MYKLKDSQHLKLCCRTVHDTDRDVVHLILIVLHRVQAGVVQQQQDFTALALELAFQAKNPRPEHVSLHPIFPICKILYMGQIRHVNVEVATRFDISPTDQRLSFSEPTKRYLSKNH